MEKIIDKIKNKTNEKDDEKNIKFEKMAKNVNLKSKEIKSINTKGPINDLCLFPESGNFIESSGPTIYDGKYNLIKTFSEIGFCDHLSLISNDIIVLSQKTNILILVISNLEENINIKYLIIPIIMR